MFWCVKSKYKSLKLICIQRDTAIGLLYMLTIKSYASFFKHDSKTFWIHQNLPTCRNKNIQFNFDNWKEKRFLCGIRKRNLSWEGSKHCHGNVAQWSDYGKFAYHIISTDMYSLWKISINHFVKPVNQTLLYILDIFINFKASRLPLSVAFKTTVPWLIILKK